jgi:hypothetical protein
MSKIVSQYADQVSQLIVYPAIALVLFMAVFAAVLLQVRRMSREHLREVSQLPFDPADEPRTPNDQNP